MPQVLLVCVGAFARAGRRGRASGWPTQGIGVTVVDPRWVLPVPDALVGLAAGHRLVVTVEDSGRHGGFGSALADALRAAECDVPLRDLALPQEFLEHGNRADVLAAVGLTAQDVARRVDGVGGRPARDRVGVAAGRRPRRLDTRGLDRFGPGELRDFGPEEQAR